MPDNAAALSRLCGCPDALHRFADGDELPIAGQLANGATTLDLEDDEVAAVLYAYSAEVPGFMRLKAPRFLDPFPRTELGKPRRAMCLMLMD